MSNPYLEGVLSEVRTRQPEIPIDYLGRKTTGEMRSIVATCDLILVPNRRSPFTSINMPTRIFEALAAGRPALVPDLPGIRDYFGNDELFYFAADNVADLALQIIAIHDDPDAVAAVVTRGQAVYHNHRWRGQRSRFLDRVASFFATGSAT